MGGPGEAVGAGVAAAAVGVDRPAEAERPGRHLVEHAVGVDVEELEAAELPGADVALDDLLVAEEAALGLGQLRPPPERLVPGAHLEPRLRRPHLAAPRSGDLASLVMARIVGEHVFDWQEQPSRLTRGRRRRPARRSGRRRSRAARRAPPRCAGPSVGPPQATSGGVRDSVRCGPSTTVVPLAAWGTRRKWRRAASWGSATHSAEFCTWWAAIPRACSVACTSSGSRAAATRRRARPARAAGAAVPPRGRPPEVGAVDQLRQRRPRLVVGAGDGDPAVLARGGVDAVRRDGRRRCRAARRSGRSWCARSSAGARKWAAASAWAKSRYWPSPVRRRWSRAASSATSARRGDV